MSTGTYNPLACATCGKPITDASFIWNGIACFHNYCKSPGTRVGPPVFPAANLTEGDVRRIVREELAALGVGAPDHQTFPHQAPTTDASNYLRGPRGMAIRIVPDPSMPKGQAEMRSGPYSVRIVGIDTGED